MMRQSAVAAAYAKARSVRQALIESGRCMEVTEDKAGIVWERWVIMTGPHESKSVILFATPDWCDVFAPLTDDQRIDALEAAIKAMRG